MSLEIIFPKFVRTYGTCMHHDNHHSNNYIVPPLINFLLSYVTLIHYGLVSQKVVQVDGTDGSTSWMWEFPDGFWNTYSSMESFALCGVPWTAPVSLEWRVLGGTTMVRGAANYTSPHIDTLLAGVEGIIGRENSLRGCPSSGLWGFESNLSAAWGCTYRQCSEYVSLGGSVHHNMGTTQPKCIDPRSGWAGKQL